MGLLYICQDGLQPSGVATYGYALLRRYRDARMLLLNAARAPLAAPPEVVQRIVLVSEDRSHNPMAVAQAIRRTVEQCGDMTTILPNTGDTPWSATVAFLRMADRTMRQSVRVLGIVHSDMETQYSIAQQYCSIAPIWIGVSRRCAGELGRRILSKADAVHELPYPIDVPAVPKQWRDGPLRLAYVGRLEEAQKRVSRLAAVFAELARRGVDFSATIAGDGPAEAELSRELAGDGQEVASRVHLAGRLGRDAIDEIWRTHDVVLLVSAFEGLPLALLEGMAAGICPVVMAIESGIEELIEDGVEGCVVGQGDVAAMADRLVEMASDRRLAQRMGVAARKRVSERFSSESHFAKLSGILERLADTPAPEAEVVDTDPTVRAAERLADAAAGFQRSVAVYGAGMFGRKVIDACVARGLSVTAWFDSDAARWGMFYCGLVCANPERVVTFDDAVFVSASLQFASEISARIKLEFTVAGKPCPEIVEID